MNKKYTEKDIQLKYINILDREGDNLFDKAMRIFKDIFKEDIYYIKEMRRMLRRKSHPLNTIFKVLVAIDKKNKQVLGSAIYRHWTDINRSTLEYLFTRLDLRGSGIGSIIYQKLQKDLISIKSGGLYFSCAGDKNLYKYEMDNKWRRINVLRVKFYEKLGARPLKGLNYNCTLYWDRPKGTYCYPNLCFDPLRKTKKNERIRISAKLVKEIIRRVMKTYYGIKSSNYKVRQILKSIKTQKLEWRETRYTND